MAKSDWNEGPRILQNSFRFNLRAFSQFKMVAGIVMLFCLFFVRYVYWLVNLPLFLLTIITALYFFVYGEHV